MEVFVEQPLASPGSAKHLGGDQLKEAAYTKNTPISKNFNFNIVQKISSGTSPASLATDCGTTRPSPPSTTSPLSGPIHSIRCNTARCTLHAARQCSYLWRILTFLDETV